MSYQNKPYFLIKGLKSGLITTRRWYTSGRYSSRSSMPNKARIDGKLEEYQILNSEDYVIWSYWKLKELQELASFLSSKCPEEKQNCNVNNLSPLMTEELLKTFKKVTRYYSFFVNLECLLYRIYKIVIWKENDLLYMYKRED